MGACDETRPYRLGVGIILVNRTGQVFAGQRIDTDQPAWQMPQGGIEEGEDPRAAAFRELREETGTDKAEIIAETAEWVTYDLPAAVSRTIWGGRYRGQKQKWYVMRFTGTDADITLEDVEMPEFSAWRWMTLEALPAHVVAFKRDLYHHIIAELGAAVQAVAL
ncbi:MAG: putative (di)nucleoside polyphosphate hydrolase [Rhodospirillaceae bacterium]|nr:MAG: putative (di)nucleoside polyphosphate hydrolase [Rhodospirillaceae bacterium]